MYDDNDLPNHAEYVVVQHAEGANLRLRLLLILGYILFSATYFIVALVTKLVPVVAVLPVFLWIIVHYTWRYVCIEHAVRVGQGTLSVEDILKDGKRIPKLTVSLKEASDLLPAAEADMTKERKAGLTVYDYRGSVHASDAYRFLFVDQNNRPSVIYIKTTPDLLRALCRGIGDKGTQS